MTGRQNHTDIMQEGWIAKTPAVIQPYLYLLRLDRPIGTWLLLLPSWWVMLLAEGLSAWPTMLLFAVGAIIMRGAGCVVNDLWDRDLDGHVERTSLRPIPSGAIKPWQALLFLFALMMVGLSILLQLNRLTVLIGMVSVLFIIAYPLMKRWTWWPQIFLGLTFNFGAIMGWTAVTGSLSLVPILIYIAGIFWTIGYDTIYAFQDRADDAFIGIKSTARLFTEQWKSPIRPLIITYCIHAVIITAAVILYFNTVSVYMLLLCLPFGHLAWQLKTLSIDTHTNTLRRFKSNRDYGLLLCVAIILIKTLL